jgi:hypothetical protein
MRPRRPVSLILVVVCLALIWPGAALTIVAGPSKHPAFSIFVACFWSLVWYFWLFRIWRGGAVAIGLMAKAAIAIPAIMLLGQVVLVLGFGAPSGITPWVATGCAVVALLCGLALLRSDVREFAAAMASAPPPPPGLLGAEPSGQEKSLYGCFMLVVVVAALIVVGVISNLASSEATGEYALMVTVGILLVVGIAGYLWLRLRAARLAGRRRGI